MNRRSVLSGEVRPIWQGEMQLGEGPVWDTASARLWFVDIKLQRVHCLDPESGKVTTWPAPAQVGWILPAGDGRFLTGLTTGLHTFDPVTGQFAHLVAIEADLSGNRLNDAAVAPDGVVWFGSMDDNEKEATGSIYRFDGMTVTRTDITRVPVTNGPCISADGQTLYHVDTQGGHIFKALIHADGSVGNSSLFATVEPREGHPDGLAIDVDGYVWVALWGGWSVRRYNPDGNLVEMVKMPVANVTKIAFGGEDLRTAYVTTAKAGLTEAALASQPLAGSLLAFQVEVVGLKSVPAKLGSPVSSS